MREVAEANRETLTVGLVKDSSVADAAGAKMGSVWLYRQFDEPKVEYSGSINAADLKSFVDAERFALIDEIGPENYKDYMDRGLPLVWIAVDPSKESEKNSFLESLQESAKKAKGKLSFTWINAVQYAQHVQNLGLKDTPGLIIIDEAKKYLFNVCFFFLFCCVCYKNKNTHK